MLNVNVGILGHVDSGKTTLSKALSTVASTSAFDKNPESKRRGITLDLGFSCFTTDLVPENLKDHFSSIQFTLVDCPGHASLIKTIISGSQIIDIMLLVVDVTKGFQTQTKESLVIGEMTCDRLVVVLNKCDLIPEAEREEKIAKMTKRVTKVLSGIGKFSTSPIVPLSAANADNLQQLIQILVAHVDDPTVKRQRLESLPFVFAVDHCFNIQAQGTIMTGTVLSGNISVGSPLEIPQLAVQKKIKSMQMFRKPVQKLQPGDRAGVCIPQIDASSIERGLVCQPGTISPVYGCILKNAFKIPYYKSSVSSKYKFNVSICHEMVLAQLTVFSTAIPLEDDQWTTFPIDLLYQEELLPGTELSETRAHQYVVLDFDHPVCIQNWGLVIGSKLDLDMNSDACRLAFRGEISKVLMTPQYRKDFLVKVPVFKKKYRIGQMDRVQSERECIVRGLFKKETNWELFYNLAVIVEAHSKEDDSVVLWSIPGTITGNFGQTGKCRVTLKEDLPEEVVKRFKEKTPNQANVTTISVLLSFKRFIFNNQKRFVQ